MTLHKNVKFCLFFSSFNLHCAFFGIKQKNNMVFLKADDIRKLVLKRVPLCCRARWQRNETEEKVKTAVCFSLGDGFVISRRASAAVDVSRRVLALAFSLLG